jgi:hypothetical protein
LLNYYGDLAGIVCAGPVDTLVALVMDGATIWPTRKYWANGIDGLAPLSFERKLSKVHAPPGSMGAGPGAVAMLMCARVTFGQPPLLTSGGTESGGDSGVSDLGDRFILTGMQDPSFDCPTPTIVGGTDGYTIVWYQPSLPAVPLTGSVSGALYQSVYYHGGDKVIYAGGAWTCIAAHQSDLTNAPPNPSFWVTIIVQRSGSPNPYDRPKAALPPGAR